MLAVREVATKLKQKERAGAKHSVVFAELKKYVHIVWHVGSCGASVCAQVLGPAMP